MRSELPLCGECSRRLDPGLTYCEGCGAPIPVQVALRPDTGRPSAPVVPAAQPANDTRPAPAQPSPGPADRAAPMVAALLRAAARSGLTIPDAQATEIAAAMTPGAEVQAVHLLRSTPDGAEVACVLTDGHLVLGPLAQDVLARSPASTWRVGRVLSLPRAEVRSLSITDRDVAIGATMPGSDNPARTQFFSVPVVVTTAEARRTLTWAVASPATTAPSGPTAAPGAHASAPADGPAAARAAARAGTSPPPASKPAAIAGRWAPDPTGMARLRWWDGHRWTEFTHS